MARVSWRSESSAPRARRPPAALLLGLCLLACSRAPAPIEGAPSGTEEKGPASAEATVPPTIVHRWIAGCHTGDDLWRWRDSTTIQCDDGGTPLVGSQGDFEWPVDLEAAQIEEAILIGKELNSLTFELSWAAPDRPFAADHTTRGVRSDSETIHFELEGRPEWEGRLRRFRLSWTGVTTPDTWLASIRFQR